MAIYGVVVPSYSLREEEPNPCNVRLADEAMRICEALTRKGHTVILVPQWEVGLALKKHGSVVEATWREHLARGNWIYEEVAQREDGSYLGTKEVVDEAIRIFKRYSRTIRFVAVANPFIHQPYTYWLARGKGVKLRWRHVRWIGFDRESTQWWCRSWWQFAYQTIRLAIGVEHGYNGRQEPHS